MRETDIGGTWIRSATNAGIDVAIPATAEIIDSVLMAGRKRAGGLCQTCVRARLPRI
jgi:hypothetical protein